MKLIILVRAAILMVEVAVVRVVEKAVATVVVVILKEKWNKVRFVMPRRSF